MELLQFIFFSSLFILNWNLFLNFVYIYVYIKLTYNNYPLTISTNDPILMISDFINMILYFIINVVSILFLNLKKYNLFNSLILNYNYYNIIYINSKRKLLFSMLSYPTKFIIKKIFKFSNNKIKPIINKPKHIINKSKPLINKPTLNSIKDLKSDNDIMYFLKNLSY